MVASRSGLRRALAGVVGLLLLSACQSGSTAPETGSPEPSTPASSSSPTTGPDSPAPGRSVYVALGDSFVAAPLVPTTDLTDGCLRSDHNYPQLVARELTGYELVDVSCAGASTTELTGPQVADDIEHPPQLDALSADVDLVTLGIGGNDFGIFGLLVSQCLNLAGAEPNGAPCRDAFAGGDNGLLDAVDKIGDRVEAVVTEIRERAPDARVVLATYPKLLPDSGACPDLVPFAAGDYPFVREVNRALAEAQAAGAEAGGAEVLDVYAASDGHDICAAQPWVNGATTDPARALAFHPFAAGQRAVADLVLELVGQG